MQVIKNWLDGSRNFSVGAILYKTFGTNEQVKVLVAKGESASAKKLLVSEFEKMLNPTQVKPLPGDVKITMGQSMVDKFEYAKAVSASSKGFAEDAPPSEAAVMPESFDEVLQSLKAKWTIPYQRMNYLRHKLDKEFDDQDSAEAVSYRKSLVFEILKLEQECIQVWKERRYYVKNGTLPNVSETAKMVIPTDPVELAGLINNIKKNIRRNRKLMVDNPENALYAQLYNEYKAKHKDVTGKEYEEKI